MTEENIITVFKDYLETKNTQHAILINGLWGSGKTYFWKNTLEKIAKDNEYKVIYISLNGIAKIEKIEINILSKLIPFLKGQDNKKLKNTATIIYNISNQVSKIFLIPP